MGVIVALSALLLNACGQRPARPISSPTGEASAASAASSTAEARVDPASIARTYPRVDGSTSVQPLQVLLACTILGVPCAWQQCMPFDRTKTIAPIRGSEASPQGVQRMWDIQHSGTHGSYMRLIAGEADFILVARPPIWR
ncbi:MAG: hypothetical protein PVF54_09635 [Anaerolineae bacterium]|jgi:hypothetical protein